MPFVFRPGFGPYRSRLARPRRWIGTAAGASFTGTSAVTLPSITSASSGAQTFAGTSAVTLPSVAVSAAGAQAHSGTSAITLPSISVAATGAQTHAATSAITLPGIASAAAGAQAFTGTSVVTLPGITVAASGTVTPVSVEEEASRGAPRVRRRRPQVLVLELEPAIATFSASVVIHHHRRLRVRQITRPLVEVSATLKAGQSRVRREVEELLLLGLGEFADGEAGALALLALGEEALLGIKDR